MSAVCVSFRVYALQAVFEVGLAAEQDPYVHKNELVRQFEESLQWWLSSRPEVLLLQDSLEFVASHVDHNGSLFVLHPS